MFSHPTPLDKPDCEKWLQADKFPLAYMRIGNENGGTEELVEMKSNLYSVLFDVIKFWEQSIAQVVQS